jgi:hypothetical protein
LIRRALYLPAVSYLQAVSARLFVVPEPFPAARSVDLFAALPEVPLGSAPAMWSRESDPDLVVVSDHQEPVLVAASTAGFVRVRRSFRRTQDMLRPPAELKYEI